MYFIRARTSSRKFFRLISNGCSSFYMTVAAYRLVVAPSFKDCLSQVTNNSAVFRGEAENITTGETSLQEVSG